MARPTKYTPETAKKITDARPQTRNANKHTPRGLGALEGSIQQDGWIGAITVAADGETFDGSARIEVGARAGFDDAIVVESDGSKPVIVKRTDIPNADDPRAVRLGVAANRIAQMDLAWDAGVLAELAQEHDLSALFTSDELAALLEDVQVEPGAGGDDFDTTPEDGPTRAQLGDLWVIGGVHRLLVGDCTDAATVARLMGGERADMAWFDPPFGIDLQPQRGNTDAIANDGNADAREVWRGFLPHLYAMLRNDTVAFLCQDWSEFDWTLPLVREVFAIKSKVVWHKTQWGIGYYTRPQHEDILYCWKGTPPKPEQAVSDVWELARLNAPEHAAEKPVGLMQRAIEFACVRSGLVVDWFAGVGGTLVAAHRTGRRAYLCELSPRYTDVILRRAEAEGLECERVDG